MKNTILLVLIIFAASSCTITNKLFHKNKTVVDSTYSHKEKSDSTSNIDSSSLHKEDKTTFTKVDSSRSDEQTTINEHTTIKEFNDSGKVKKETVIEKKTEIKKGSSTGSIAVFENAGKIDSTELKKEAQVSKQSSDSGGVQKKDVVVDKHKKTSRFPVIPVTISIIIVAIVLFIFFYIRRKKKQIEAAAKLIIPPSGL